VYNMRIQTRVLLGQSVEELYDGVPVVNEFTSSLLVHPPGRIRRWGCSGVDLSVANKPIEQIEAPKDGNHVDKSSVEAPLEVG